MPAEYTIDRERRTVFLVVSGKLDLAGARDVLRRIAADKDFDPSFQELVDARHMELPELFYEDLRAIAHEMDPFLHSARRAIMAPEGAIYGISRMYQLLRGDENIRVFTTRQAALEWLGLAELQGAHARAD